MPATTEVKIVSDNGRSFMVAGYGIIWGGSDLIGDYFSKGVTDFWFDKLTQTPMVLYQHGQDATLKRTVVGRVVSKTEDSVGLWVEAQITAAKQYADAIRELVAKGVLGWSSGSVPHLVQRVKGTTPGTSEITSWPVVELSLTPTPAEPRTVGVKELKALAEFDPLLYTIAEEAIDVEAKATHDVDSVVASTSKGATLLTDLPDEAFAWIEPGGTKDDGGLTFPRAKRLYPHHDENGNVDLDSLASSLAEARKNIAPDKVIAHLKLHAIAAGVDHHTHDKDNAHTKQYVGDAPARMLVAIHKLTDLYEATVAQHIAMDVVHTPTKDGARMMPDLAQMLDEIVDDLHQVADWAKTVDRGADGRARVNRLRAELELMEV